MMFEVCSMAGSCPISMRCRATPDHTRLSVTMFSLFLLKYMRDLIFGFSRVWLNNACTTVDMMLFCLIWDVTQSTVNLKRIGQMGLMGEESVMVTVVDVHRANYANHWRPMT